MKDVDRLVDHFNTLAGGQLWQDDSDDESVLTRNRVATDIYQNAETVIHCSTTNNVWSLSLLDREKLIQTWKDEIEPRTILDRTVEIHRRHQVAVQRKREVFSEIDARSLAGRGSPMNEIEGFRLTYRRGHNRNDNYELRQTMAYA